MNLRQIRKESGLKAEKVAKELGVSRRQLYNYEENPKIINDKKFDILCKMYNKSKDEIMEVINSKG